MQPQLGLQLYTVRDLIAAQGFVPVVRRVAEIGYAGVETAGFSGTTPQEAAKLFRDLGLQVSSGHFPLPIGDESARTLDAAKTIGTRRLVSGRGPDDFRTMDGLKHSCDLFNQAAAVAAENGMTFAIHNHWWEFEKLDGRPIYELMLENLNPRVEFELDVYWAQTAGADPAAVVKRLGKRAPLLHIKDGPCEQGKSMTAVGAGKVNFNAIAEAGSNATWWIVELDACASDMMEAVSQSHRYVTAEGFAIGK